jgi:hypothetical protein
MGIYNLLLVDYQLGGTDRTLTDKVETLQFLWTTLPSLQTSDSPFLRDIFTHSTGFTE